MRFGKNVTTPSFINAPIGAYGLVCDKQTQAAPNIERVALKITRSQRIFLFVVCAITIVFSAVCLLSGAGGYASLWFVGAIASGFFALGKREQKIDRPAMKPLSKPEALINLPIFLMFENEEPFNNFKGPFRSEKKQAISFAAGFYKIFMYNVWLTIKIGGPQYFNTIVEKQRERIAAADIGVSEEFVSIMNRMSSDFHTCFDGTMPDDEANFKFMHIEANLLIDNDDLFSDLRGTDDQRKSMIDALINVFQSEEQILAASINKFWQNGAFNQNELRDWFAVPVSMR